MQQRQQLSGERSSLLVTQRSSDNEASVPLKWRGSWASSGISCGLTLRSSPCCVDSPPSGLAVHARLLEYALPWLGKHSYLCLHTCYKNWPFRGGLSRRSNTEKLKFKTPVENILYSEDQIRSIRKSYEKRKAVSWWLVINAGTAPSLT